jgi:hypothetical protein
MASVMEKSFKQFATKDAAKLNGPPPPSIKKRKGKADRVIKDPITGSVATNCKFRKITQESRQNSAILDPCGSEDQNDFKFDEIEDFEEIDVDVQGLLELVNCKLQK